MKLRSRVTKQALAPPPSPLRYDVPLFLSREDFTPLPTTSVRAFIFFARRLHLVLPSSTRIQLRQPYPRPNPASNPKTPNSNPFGRVEVGRGSRGAPQRVLVGIFPKKNETGGGKANLGQHDLQEVFSQARPALKQSHMLSR